LKGVAKYMDREELKDEYLEDYDKMDDDLDSEFDDEEESYYDEEENTLNVTLDDILNIASGVDEDGYPFSSATISIENDNTENRTFRPKTVDITMGEFNFYIDGGCAVMQIDFPHRGMSEYKKVMHICKDWTENKYNNYSEDVMMSTLVVPRLLKGQIVFMFQDLVYYTGIVLDNLERIILCFDNTQSNVIENENINYEEIERTVEDELRKEEEELDRQYFEVKKELEEAENVNYYEENIKEKMNIDYTRTTDDADDSNQDTEKIKRKYGMRINNK
jgi:hypothetical protein